MDKEQVYQALNNERSRRTIQPGEIYVSEYAKDNGLNVDNARNFLRFLERKGIVAIRIVTCPRRALVFRLLQQSDDLNKPGSKKIKTF